MIVDEATAIGGRGFMVDDASSMGSRGWILEIGLGLPIIIRLKEGWIFGSLLGYAEDHIPDVKFYSAEEEPSVSAEDCYAVIFIDLDDEQNRTGQWDATGILTFGIQCRKNVDPVYAGNIYNARSVAHELSELFVNAAVNVGGDEIGRDTAGHVLVGLAETYSQGEAAGVIHHQWSANFKVINN